MNCLKQVKLKTNRRAKQEGVAMEAASSSGHRKKNSFMDIYHCLVMYVNISNLSMDMQLIS